MRKGILLSIFCIFLTHSTKTQLTPVIDIFDPVILDQLDQLGQFSLASVLSPKTSDQAPDYLQEFDNTNTNSRLRKIRLNHLYEKNLWFRNIADSIESDIQELMKESNLKLAYSSNHAEKIAYAGNVGRHFDWLWLKSPSAAFPLIAVINRLDRKDFNPKGCGEIRFIYRLAYSRQTKASKKAVNYSTLPVFLNAVFENISEDCHKTAQSWRIPPAYTSLVEGPLNKKLLKLKQVELNMQAFRFPSGQMTHFGGQAMYLFRIFAETDNIFQPIALENTPDVNIILKNPMLQQNLLNQILNEKNLQKIDQGVLVLENFEKKILAKRALSFSTTGHARLANRPYAKLFQTITIPQTIKSKINFEQFKLINSWAGLVERLDSMTCMGCHQNNGTAGFHILGMNSENNSSFNQVALPFSPHVYAERDRRLAYLTALIRKTPENLFRPPSVYTGADWSNETLIFKKPEVRSLCIPDTNHFKLPLPCASENNKCEIMARNSQLDFPIGECVIKTGAPRNIMFSGHACRYGDIKNFSSITSKELSEFNLLNFQDEIYALDGQSFPENYYAKSENFRNFFCGIPEKGTPLGRIGKSCSNQSPEGKFEFADNFNLKTIPPEICAVSGGSHFDICAAGSDPITCLTKTPAARTMLDTCHEGNFCREDYICQKLPVEISENFKGNEKKKVKERILLLSKNNVGFCTPNYFLFNMRIDGHILPELREQKK